MNKKHTSKYFNNIDLNQLLNLKHDDILFLNRITAINIILDDNTPLECKRRLKLLMVYSDRNWANNYNEYIELPISTLEVIKIYSYGMEYILEGVRYFKILNTKELRDNYNLLPNLLIDKNDWQKIKKLLLVRKV